MSQVLNEIKALLKFLVVLILIRKVNARHQMYSIS